MVDAYLFRFLLIWSQKISDKQVLQQLYSLVFSKIADMQTRLSETLNSWLGGYIDIAMMVFVMGRLRGVGGARPLERHLDSFKEPGMEIEIELVIDSLWKIFGELQPDIYPEPRTHGWAFKYGEDDWRKLVNLIRKYRKSIRHSKDRARSSAAA
jgi:hypothetical protein